MLADGGTGHLRPWTGTMTGTDRSAHRRTRHRLSTRSESHPTRRVRRGSHLPLSIPHSHGLGRGDLSRSSLTRLFGGRRGHLSDLDLPNLLSLDFPHLLDLGFALDRNSGDGRSLSWTL